MHVDERDHLRGIQRKQDVTFGILLTHELESSPLLSITVETAHSDYLKKITIFLWCQHGLSSVTEVM